MTSPNPRGAMLVRAVLAAVVILDLFSFYGFLLAARTAAAARDAPIEGLAAVVSLPIVSGALIAIGTAAAIAFAFQPGRFWAGALALGALTLLSTAHAQLFGSPWRHLFYSGLCLAGWLVGLVASRRRGTPTDESYAYTGAVALLGAAYCSAGISKLAYGARDWLSAVPIQSVVLGQDGLVADSVISSYRAWVVSTPAAGVAFSLATVVFELAGPLMLVGVRTRLLVAAGLMAMHTNILILTGILYWESMLLLALFALAPQPAAPQARAVAASTQTRLERRYRVALVVLFGCLLLAVDHQARRYARLHTSGVAAGTPPPTVTPTVLRQVGPFALGQTLAQTWVIDALDLSDDGVVVAVSRAREQARFELTCAPSPHRSPFDVGAAHIFYSSDVSVRELEPIGAALQDRLREAADGDDVCAHLQAWRTTAQSAAGP